jgi:hypothetical protein
MYRLTSVNIGIGGFFSNINDFSKAFIATFWTEVLSIEVPANVEIKLPTSLRFRIKKICSLGVPFLFGVVSSEFYRSCVGA